MQALAALYKEMHSSVKSEVSSAKAIFPKPDMVGGWGSVGVCHSRTRHPRTKGAGGESVGQGEEWVRGWGGGAIFLKPDMVRHGKGLWGWGMYGRRWGRVGRKGNAGGRWARDSKGVVVWVWECGTGWDRLAAGKCGAVGLALGREGVRRFGGLPQVGHYMRHADSGLSV